MPDGTLGEIIERRRLRNAVATWLLIAVLFVTAGGAVLGGEPIWGLFVALVGTLAVIPAVATRRATAMLPWEVVLLAALPAIGRVVVVGQQLDGVELSGRVSTYLAVAAAALILAVELDTFTGVKMSDSFAVGFTAIATTAAAGAWALLRYGADQFLGTQLLLDGRPEEVIETALMWDFVAATAVGLGAGVLFEFYFRRRARVGSRLPREVQP